MKVSKIGQASNGFCCSITGVNDSEFAERAKSIYLFNNLFILFFILFDPYTVMSALKQVVSVAMEKRDNRAKRYGIILKQARPLISSRVLRSVIIKLVV